MLRAGGIVLPMFVIIRTIGALHDVIQRRYQVNWFFLLLSLSLKHLSLIIIWLRFWQATTTKNVMVLHIRILKMPHRSLMDTTKKMGHCVMWFLDIRRLSFAFICISEHHADALDHLLHFWDQKARPKKKKNGIHVWNALQNTCL